MTRTLVTRVELMAWMTTELQKVEDCGNCSVTRVLPLQESDEDGCNWSSQVMLSISGDDVSSEYVWPYLNVIVTEARARFDLKD
jgi:hypothetical protein